ncbi:hypothetical protein [Chengkuizengella sediminis]|uniref:hypothetical protein n=1 Tax=Chengkuizengella sediminis TaxID=1885917 RepID=UPI001389BF24|nr:hypothetical protein [Chengkuizengella sediminis]NDI36185.1 hypothetical protein [Chengkuizengella sediminis]
MYIKSYRLIYLTMFIVFINVILVLLLIIPRNHHQTSQILDGSEAAYIVEWTEEIPVNSQLNRTENTESKGNKYFVTLEKQLVDSKVEGEVLIETYQEFEIYKNQFGEVVQIFPTSNFEYLRYSIRK